MKELYRFVLGGKVVPKKNSKQIFKVKGRTIIAPSSQFLDWDKQAKHFVVQQKVALGIAEPIQCCEVSIKFGFGDNAQRDLTNIAESIMDMLVDCGVLLDDNAYVVGNLKLSTDLFDNDFRTTIDIKPIVASEKIDYDKLWSEFIKKRAGRRCQLCGSDATDAHHVNGKATAILRYNTANGIALCRSCHDHSNGKLRAECNKVLKRFDKVKLYKNYYTNWAEKNRKEISPAVENTMKVFLLRLHSAIHSD